MPMPKISILGCGWLGLPLGKKLVENGYTVKGSTTSGSKLPTLENSGIEPFLISVSTDGIHGNTADFLNSEILIIDIPPKVSEGNFVEKIIKLIPLIEQSAIENVLFVSSISVYADDGLVTEETPTSPDSESGKQLVEAENLLQNNPNFKTTVLRFGGLVGNDRHPVKHLAGRENLPNPNAPINLIHLQDCIGIIEKIISGNAWDETFNAVTPFHPSRQEFYIQKALEMKLEIPSFDHSIVSAGKIVDSKKLIEKLNYTFSDLLQ